MKETFESKGIKFYDANDKTIAFKAKGLKDNKWRYGYIIKVGNISYIINNLSNVCDNFIYNKYPVKEETICQYTGLHDKKGNEIYEPLSVQYNKKEK